jgi:hypothetical protein
VSPTRPRGLLGDVINNSIDRHAIRVDKDPSGFLLTNEEQTRENELTAKALGALAKEPPGPLGDRSNKQWPSSRGLVNTTRFPSGGAREQASWQSPPLKTAMVDSDDRPTSPSSEAGVWTHPPAPVPSKPSLIAATPDKIRMTKQPEQQNEFWGPQVTQIGLQADIDALMAVVAKQQTEINAMKAMQAGHQTDIEEMNAEMRELRQGLMEKSAEIAMLKSERAVSGRRGSFEVCSICLPMVILRVGQGPC